MHVNKHFPALSNSPSITQFKSCSKVPDRRHHKVFILFDYLLERFKTSFFLSSFRILDSLGTGSTQEHVDCLVISLLYLKVSSHLTNGVSFRLSKKLFPYSKFTTVIFHALPLPFSNLPSVSKSRRALRHGITQVKTD